MQNPSFTVEPVIVKDNYGQFVIEPLENGFGHTLGNALRRVLLSSFKGAAITEVKVEGVNHKFSSLTGMSEDMVDLMLNLKGVKVSYEGDEPVLAHLSVKGPKSVKASDIVAPPGVKIVNQDASIAELAKGAKLDIELKIETGYGYSPSEERSSSTVGVLVLDAIYSPVERVSYKVEATRVGRRTDFDKLVIDIYTDGAVSPSVVLKTASSTLVSYFSQIVSPKVETEGGIEQSSSSVSGIALEELGLPTRITNALKNADYKTASELSKATDKDLKEVKNLGEKSLDVIDEALESKGFKRTK